MISQKKKFKLSYQILLIAIFYWLFYASYFGLLAASRSLAHPSYEKKIKQTQVKTLKPEVSLSSFSPLPGSSSLKTPVANLSSKTSESELLLNSFPSPSVSATPLYSKKEYLFIEENPSQKPSQNPLGSSLATPKGQPENPQPKLAKLRIVIDEVIKEYELEVVPQKTTVLDLLLEAQAKYGLQFGYHGEGPSAFIESIAGISNSERYWLYYVNGEFAQRGAGSQKVKEGDLIEWRYE